MEHLITNDNIKKSRMPARLDFAQSGTGLVLGLFMWAHMMLVASIILGKGSFNFVAKTMELRFLSDTGHGYPSAVFFAVLIVFTLFIIHALLGMRKFPISWKQHAIMRHQMKMMKHEDTNLWYIQVVTGFLMFFLGSVHLYTMLTHPDIDPYASADRFWFHSMWPLYLMLLFCVELHGTIGLYRLCMKWGWLDGNDPIANRERLKLFKKRATYFFLGLGLLAFIIFMVIGFGHRHNAGQKYTASIAAVDEAAAPAHEADAAVDEASPPAHEEEAAVDEEGAVSEEAAPAQVEEAEEDSDTGEAVAQEETAAEDEAADVEAAGEETAESEGEATADDAHDTTTDKE